MKIFGVGQIKTGTVSLGKALSTLGYNHCFGSFRTGNMLLNSYLTNNKGKLHETINKHDSFEDFPFCAPGMPQYLDKQYPGSKFIMTTREPESWYKSLIAYFNPQKKHPFNLLDNYRGLNGLPLGPMFGLVNYILATFGTHELTRKEHVLKMYNQYHQEVQDYFSNKPGKLLVISWMNGDGWDKLCPFLGKPIPKARFPHANRNPKK